LYLINSSSTRAEMFSLSCYLLNRTINKSIVRASIL
jgi:hypothetical protein